MATFSTRGPEVGASGIGAQQVVGANRPSISNTISEIGNIAQKTGAAAAPAIEAEGLEAAEDAQLTLNAGIAAANAGLDEVPPGVDIGEKDFKLIQEGLAQGKLDRTQAKLLTSNIIKKRTAERPFFSRKIREAADQAQGFDSRYELTKAFFTNFDKAGSNKPNATDQKINRWIESGAIKNRQEGLELLSNNEVDQIRADKVKRDLEQGTIDAEAGFQEISRINQRAIQQDILGPLRVQFNSGVPITPEMLADSVNAARDGAKMRLADSLTGVAIDPARRRAMEAELDQQYTYAQEAVNAMGTDKIGRAFLDGFVTQDKLWGRQALPVMTKLTNALGERNAGEVFKLMNTAANNPAKFRLLVKNNPAFGEIVSAMDMNPTEASKMLQESYTKFMNGGKLTQEESVAADVVIADLYSKIDQEGKQSVVDRILAQGQNVKGTSLLARKGGRENATPEQVKFMVDNYKAGVNTIQKNLVDAIKDNPNLKLILDEDSGEPRVVDTERGIIREVTFGPIAEEANKLNIWSNAARNGWAKDLGVKDVGTFNRNFIKGVNNAAGVQPAPAPKAQPEQFNLPDALGGALDTVDQVVGDATGLNALDETLGLREPAALPLTETPAPAGSGVLLPAEQIALESRLESSNIPVERRAIVMKEIMRRQERMAQEARLKATMATGGI